MNKQANSLIQSPETSWEREWTTPSNIDPQQRVRTWIPQLTVNWASCDFAAVTSSLGSVDGSDLAFFSNYLGDPVTWGFSVAPHNFEVNVNPYGTSWNFIDGSDLSIMATRLADDVCGLTPSKTGQVETAADILEWFGVGLTGGMVLGGPNGEMIPEYAVVDPDQNRRAIADPYGYRRETASSGTNGVTWGLVKTLFR
jgi:hypothetical protein